MKIMTTDTTVLYQDRSSGRGFPVADQLQHRNIEEVKGYVHSLMGRYHPSRPLSTPVDDLAWDCYTDLWRRRAFAKYDSSRSREGTYLYNCVSRWLIDRERRANAQPKLVSAGLEGDVPVAMAAVGTEAYMDIMGHLPQPGQDGALPPLTPETTWYMALAGYTHRQIAEGHNMSLYHVRRHYREAKAAYKAGLAAHVDISPARAAMAPACPHCGSRHTYRRRWAGKGWSCVPAHECRGCGKGFSAFTGTPMLRLSNPKRMEFIRVAHALARGEDMGRVFVKEKIPFKRVKKIKQQYEEYFDGEPVAYVKAKLAKWQSVVTIAEAHKKRMGEAS
jgi:DNA-directed RNA polymerase specialized sigma24 family protein/transposase-like protein